MGKLSSDRATKEESLIEVGACLCAVDRILGGEDSSTPNANADARPNVRICFNTMHNRSYFNISLFLVKLIFRRLVLLAILRNP